MPTNNVIPLPEPKNDLQQQATSWVVRLNSGEASQADRQAFIRWVQQKEEHQKAFFAARGLWQQIGDLDLPIGNIQNTHQEKRHSKIILKYQPHKLYLTVALSFLIVCVFWVQPVAVRYLLTDYSTSVGEVKTVNLSDGSTVHLNTDTLIAENFSAQQRNIELLSGEAEFVVAHDKNRPFIVRASTGKTRALGTRFVVNYHNNIVKVNVLENAVEISSDNHVSVTLDAGYKLEYSNSGLLDVPKATSESEANAWRSGKLKFNAQPLKASPYTQL